ncbi:hypothetical protein DM02DRAFT_82843 [Periconia macrospinosa]|uniref:Uncharacterized protein n=1 Tax=Periconia macrospinosa TaxID=97972 RepID=A0A2V1DIB8_9PLEO|nr:hypothetical protein DM02DRAFT_82843 [Periconia macrospinosa]
MAFILQDVPCTGCSLSKMQDKCKCCILCGEFICRCCPWCRNPPDCCSCLNQATQEPYFVAPVPTAGDLSRGPSTAINQSLPALAPVPGPAPGPQQQQQQQQQQKAQVATQTVFPPPPPLTREQATRGRGRPKKAPGDPKGPYTPRGQKPKVQKRDKPGRPKGAKDAKKRLPKGYSQKARRKAFQEDNAPTGDSETPVAGGEGSSSSAQQPEFAAPLRQTLPPMPMDHDFYEFAATALRAYNDAH